MKGKAILIILLLALTLTGCKSEKPEYTGNKIIIQPAANVDEGSFKISNISRPPSKTLFTPKEINLNEETTSVYFDSLSGVKQKIYSDLLNTVSQGGTNFIPSQKLNASEVKHLMRILLLDEPKAYAVNKVYHYNLNEDGSVANVILSYNKYMNTEVIEEEYTALTKEKRNNKYEDYTFATNHFVALSQSSVFDNKRLLVLYRQIIKELNPSMSTGEIESAAAAGLADFEEHIKDTALALKFTNKATEEAYAKAFSSKLRANGMKSASIYGERTSSLDKSYSLANKFSGLKETEEKTDNGIKVTLDSTGLNVWNMFLADNGWYNSDILLSKAIAEKISKEATKDIKPLLTTPLSLGMSDEQFALSKLSYHNEDVLGVNPMSYDDLASSLRTGKDRIFIEGSSMSRLSDDLARVVPNHMSAGNNKGILVSFNQSDVFGYFILSQDILFDKFSKQKLINFSKYDFILIPEIQSVYFYNFR
mgnify:CR=1 FL=1